MMVLNRRESHSHHRCTFTVTGALLILLFLGICLIWWYAAFCLKPLNSPRAAGAVPPQRKSPHMADSSDTDRPAFTSQTEYTSTRPGTSLGSTEVMLAHHRRTQDSVIKLNLQHHIFMTTCHYIQRAHYTKLKVLMVGTIGKRLGLMSTHWA